MIAALADPWRHARTWRRLVHVLIGPVVATVTFVPMVALVATTIGSAFGFFPLVVPVVYVFFALSRVLAALQRSRVAVLLDEPLADPVPPLVRERWWQRFFERFTVAARWKEVAHHLLGFPVAMIGFTATLVAWCGSAALIALPAYAGALPGGTAKFGLFEVSPGPLALALGVIGIVGLVLIGPWLTLGVAHLQRLFARWALGPSGATEMARQVTRAESQRRAAVTSAEDERRRIERDLHDGAQQRLVALTVDLGVARDRLAEDPETGRVMVADAHEEAKAALAELRDLVRGIHPVILEDRGLDAALSAVVARSAVPVTLAVDVAERPAPEIESAAYFVVSEALANIARHARARSASVSVVRAAHRLVVEVRDDGRGGADPSRGTGLAGLTQRIEALGGSMHILSPAGGPTTVLADLPCGS